MAESVEDIIADVIERRAAGEVVTDAEVLAAHPELRAELAEELAALRAVHRAMLAAHRSRSSAGGSAASAPSPADTADTAVPASGPAAALPHIHGYLVLREIGRGGQGCVYLAVHEPTGRRMALKVVGDGSPLTSSRQRKRFGREADVMATVDHPHVVKITDRGYTRSGALYLAMDYIDGPALDEWLIERRTCSSDYQREVARLFAAIARAAHECHRHGIIHRDLKPTNIRVDRHDRPYILDFGLARVSDGVSALEQLTVDGPHATLAGQVIGSLPWASPEQAAGRLDEVGAQSDVYSLGIMLYQALTGDFPYPVTVELRQLLENIERCPPRAPIRLAYHARPRCDSALEAIVLKAIAKPRHERYASAAELADDLERWLAGEPVTADLSRQRRRWQLRAAVAGVLVLLIATVAAAIVLSRPTPPTVFTRPAFVNHLGIRMVKLDPGPVIVGSPLEEPGRQINERQWVTRIERPFWIATTEVTRGQYRALMGKLPAGEQEAIAAGTLDPETADDSLPITHLTWHEAVAFCQALSEAEGRRYRLPSEIEWEYAARAGTQGRFGGSGQADSMAWHAGNSGRRLQHIATRWPNHWGLHDLHGNAAEWCSDPYGPTYPTENSVDTRIPPERRARVIRGGSAQQPPEECRSAARTPAAPDWYSPFLGFRVAMDDPPTVSQVESSSP